MVRVGVRARVSYAKWLRADEAAEQPATALLGTSHPNPSPDPNPNFMAATHWAASDGPLDKRKARLVVLGNSPPPPSPRARAP